MNERDTRNVIHLSLKKSKTIILAIFLVSIFTVCSKPSTNPLIETSPSLTPVVTQNITQGLEPGSPTPKTTPNNPIRAKAQVIKVVDGDTIDVSIGSEIYRVRYIGINTPETVDPNKPIEYFGPEASAKNKELVAGKTVYLEKDTSEIDRYSRLLRYVYLGNLFVNYELVRQGYAYATPYPQDVKYESTFYLAQQQAKNEKIGLWANAQFIGNKGSMIYHDPNCESVRNMSESNKVIFNSFEAAKKAGYKSCSNCKPP